MEATKAEKQRNRELTLEEELYRAGLIFLVVGIVSTYGALKWIFPHLKGTECIFQKLFGVYCPGCGGTRALIAFLHGQFVESFLYHPIVMYTAVMFGWFMLSHTMEKLHFPVIRGMAFRTWHMYGALVLIIVNCLLRNILKFGFDIAYF